MGDIALALLGPDCFEYEERAAPVVLVKRDPWRIVLRFDLTREELTYAIAAAIVEWWSLTRPGSCRDCSPSAIAAYIVVPTEALRDSIDRLEGDVQAIAREFVCWPELVTRRIADLRARPSSNVRIRGLAS